MRWLWIALALAAFGAATAQAATDIPAPPGKIWKHKPTGSQFPVTLAGLKRTRVAFFTAPEVDVAADYWSDDGNDKITVYLFRNVAGDVPVWFDRARFFIMNLPDNYGVVKPGGTRPFTPRGQQQTSGLMEIFEPSKNLRSTGLAVLPYKQFYAKFRVSSATRDPAALESLLLQALNTFDWSSRTDEFAAQPVADCPQPLAQRSPAKLAEGSSEDQTMSSLLGGLLAQAAPTDSKSGDESAERVAFCREPGSSELGFGVYRLAGDSDRFLMAVLDGGRVVSVGRNELLGLVGEKNRAPRYSVSYIELDKTATYADFASLPLPSQVAETIDKGVPSSVATTWGKKRGNVSITLPEKP